MDGQISVKKWCESGTPPTKGSQFTRPRTRFGEAPTYKVVAVGQTSLTAHIVSSDAGERFRQVRFLDNDLVVPL
jgi:hypothetical protein